MKLNKAKELPKTQRIVIKLKNTNGEPERKVYAPLPDGYGMSVGSSFTDPQNADLSGGGGGGGLTGAVTKGVTAAVRRTGFSTKITQATNVFYDGPEPTELSFDLNFHAYYSAYHEVIVPVFDLMMMSVGREYSIDDIDNQLPEAMKSLLRASASTAEQDTGKYGFIRSPGECRVNFGTSFKIPRCYVASVGTEFSNIMDNQGYPMSANCSVTLKVIRNPTQAELPNYFNT